MQNFLELTKTLDVTLQKAKEEFHREEVRLKALQEHLKKEQDELAKRFPINDTIIELNVGGTAFTTYKTTLCKYEGTLLEAMFSGRHPFTKDSQGRYFIDTSPRMFEYILEFLRKGIIYNPQTAFEKQLWNAEIDYFGLREAIESVNPLVAFDSRIITSLNEYNCLKQWLDCEDVHFELLFRATEHGFNATSFHARADNKGPSLTIIRSNTGYIFGGYNPVSWTSKAGWTQTNESWLFALRVPSNQMVKLSCTNISYAIYDHPTYGPTFGGGHDSYLENNMNNFISKLDTAINCHRDVTVIPSLLVVHPVGLPKLKCLL